MAKGIFEQWDLLRKIVERHEATIQRRWVKKSKPKRRENLLAAWPGMSESHRPDIAAFRKGKTGDAAREACMWPHFNLEDLTKTEPLLLMLNARGRSPPDVFAMGDVDETRFGQVSRTIDMPRFLNLYSMLFLGRTEPGTYGELVSWDDEPDGCDWNYKRTAVDPGEGLWILEIQSRLYRFLVDVSKAILHDIPAEELTDPNMAIPPEPPLVTGNPGDSYTASLAVTTLEGPYRLPASLDLKRLKSIVESKLAEAQDHLWALREDPGYFSATLKDWKEHRQEMLPDTNGKPHPILAHSPDVIWQRVIGNLISSALMPAEVWRSILERITRVIDLMETKYKDRRFERKEDLPKDLAVAFCKLKHHLQTFQPGPISDLKMGWVASPPMRPYWRRKPPPNAVTPQIEVVSIHRRDMDESVSEIMWIIQCLFDDQQRFLAGLPTLLDELERVMKKDRAASQLVSGWVASQISDLSVLSECERQIDLFQPWASTFQATAAGHNEEIERDFHETVRRLRPLNDMKISQHTVKLGIPDEDKFKYPAEKRRNKANAEQMRSAEAVLDAFWVDIQRDLERREGVSLQLRSELRRPVQRTPEWVEPPKAKAKGAQTGSGAEAALAAPFGGLTMEDAPGEKPSTQPKSKTKAKGTAQPDAETQAPVEEADATKGPEQDKQPSFKVDKRALKVAWTEFLHAMQTVGFNMEKLHGSAWKFTPTRIDVESSIQFHEPHPSSKLPFVGARRIGRRLNREYGWTGDMFTPI
ncbi:hypothetical protein CMUS01_05284 [Colletotrichum musicola]|uniref:Uncharacterized protein n=1 Tax=Colletotrichum musicola TaxID=2175873 RepID=A0A8H6KSD7_9PEZI|nr:hypothetical protein CMUS01_05284 [Colletotrichum musicola]